MRDGEVFTCDSMSILLSIRMGCARIGRERGIVVAAHRWGELAHVEDEPGLYYHVQEFVI